jgi:hypothetical protein
MRRHAGKSAPHLSIAARKGHDCQLFAIKEQMRLHQQQQTKSSWRSGRLRTESTSCTCNPKPFLAVGFVLTFVTCACAKHAVTLA